MVGPVRPQFVLFGSSIVQLSFSNGGWGAILADVYARKADILLRGYFGWNSRRAIQVLDHVFPKDASTQPELIITYFGGNDSMGAHPSGLGPHVPLPEYIENMKQIVNYLKDLQETDCSTSSKAILADLNPVAVSTVECLFSQVVGDNEKMASNASDFQFFLCLLGLSDSTRLIFLTSPPVDEERVNKYASEHFSHLVRTNELCQTYADACVKLCQELDVKVVNLFTAFQRRENWMTDCFTDGVHLSAEGSKIVVAEILKVLKEAEWKPSLHWKSMPTEFAEDSPYDIVGADGKTTLNPSEWTFHREVQWD
ncbi:GDSL esterase/lipase CPRD49 [Gossypium australe]|uniref:GDSL esterase/lipase CPRD49 n=1 Tax=Gossypium australe TaxID=47621 RepID=A0A5B6UA32_9ROSI|nr:GDSL esterase/lipase CPRD49 [Gossypium australe]